MRATVKHKFLISLIFNYSILIAQSIAMVLSISRHGTEVFLYYTNLSNYFSIIPAVLFCIFALRTFCNNKPIPFFIIRLRFISTVTLMVTFFVSVFIIIPMIPSLTSYMLIEGSSFFQHVYCPIVSLISFIFFERGYNLKRLNVLFAIIPTLIYGFTLIALNLLKLVIGPYPFFYVYKIPWYISTLSIITIILITLMATLLIRLLYNAQPKEIKSAKIKHGTT